jgi:Zn-dependent peptidase ImmA (M78 family)/transcriptional regulator with XRE-family HTH domain
MNIGAKIQNLRLEYGLSQQQLAVAMGWNHQTVSELEQGNRDIKATELSKLTQFFSVPLSFFLDNQEKKRSVLTHGTGFPEARFIQKCEDYKVVEELVYGIKNNPSLLPKINLSMNKWQINDAYRLATEVRHLLHLGAYPAYGLHTSLEEQVGIRFISEKVPQGPSSGCSRYEQECFIWINEAKKNSGIAFTIAHELFHLITFDAALHESIKNNCKYNDKNELLADAFAAGLLVPEEQLRLELSRLDQRLQLSDVVAIASQFRVSPEALLHRLHNLKSISKPLLETYLRKFKHYEYSNETMPDLNRRFVSLVYLAYQHDKINRSKAAKLLNIDASALKEYFAGYGYPIFAKAA